MAQTEKFKEPLTSFEQGKQAVTGIANNLTERARDVASEAKEYAVDQVESAEALIKKYPLQSFLIGMGVGCLVGVGVAAIVRR